MAARRKCVPETVLRREEKLVSAPHKKERREATWPTPTLGHGAFSAGCELLALLPLLWRGDDRAEKHVSGIAGESVDNWGGAGRKKCQVWYVACIGADWNWTPSLTYLYLEKKLVQLHLVYNDISVVRNYVLFFTLNLNILSITFLLTALEIFANIWYLRFNR